MWKVEGLEIAYYEVEFTDGTVSVKYKVTGENRLVYNMFALLKGRVTSTNSNKWHLANMRSLCSPPNCMLTSKLCTHPLYQ